MKFKPEIVFEDDYFVAINKPAGMLTIPDRFRKDIPNLFAILSKNRPELYTVHRLDKFTSGGILFAKSKEVHKALSEAFMERTPEKYYLAIVDGVPRESTGTINQPLTESMTTRGKMLVHPRGKESQTSYEVVQSFVKFSHLRVKIHTGRLHQIRVHLAHIGHPLMVDSLYGNREEFFLSEIKGRKYHLKQGEEERPLLTRQPLHSHKLIIPHPHSGEQMTFEFEPPKDIRATLKQFEKILK
ncbi:MAG: RluA family pseudouridine synthase [Saprospiraceae bacterium]|nr:RluA family pseudouridine synthase [Saprospiraceae bacterium]